MANLVFIAVSPLDFLLERCSTAREEDIESICDETCILLTLEFVIRREDTLEVATVPVLKILSSSIFSNASQEILLQNGIMV